MISNFTSAIPWWFSRNVRVKRISVHSAVEAAVAAQNDSIQQTFVAWQITTKRGGLFFRQMHSRDLALGTRATLLFSTLSRCNSWLFLFCHSAPQYTLSGPAEPMGTVGVLFPSWFWLDPLNIFHLLGADHAHIAYHISPLNLAMFHRACRYIQCKCCCTIVGKNLDH